MQFSACISRLNIIFWHHPKTVPIDLLTVLTGKKLQGKCKMRIRENRTLAAYDYCLHNMAIKAL